MVVNDHFTSYIICIQILLMNIMQHSSLEIGRKYDQIGVVFDYLSLLSSRVKYISHSWHKYKLCITQRNQFLKCFCSPISVSQEYTLLHPRIHFFVFTKFNHTSPLSVISELQHVNTNNSIFITYTHHTFIYI